MHIGAPVDMLTVFEPCANQKMDFLLSWFSTNQGKMSRHATPNGLGCCDEKGGFLIFFEERELGKGREPWKGRVKRGRERREKGEGPRAKGEIFLFLIEKRAIFFLENKGRGSKEKLPRESQDTQRRKERESKRSLVFGFLPFKMRVPRSCKKKC